MAASGRSAASGGGPRRCAPLRRLAGSGASTLSVHGLFGNGPLEAGLTAPLLLRLLRRQPGTLGDAGGSTRRPVERGGNRVERNRQRAGARGGGWPRGPPRRAGGPGSG